MTGYNKINGDYAGGNTVLIQDALKGAWGYPGWVMSDRGATLQRDRAGNRPPGDRPVDQESHGLESLFEGEGPGCGPAAQSTPRWDGT
jgi:hypothetical protein